ncbi:MAG: transposase [Terracidiphilus sp.]|jgi:pilus assembly protein CpaE
MAPRASSERFGRKSEREVYLDRMDEAMPWGELLALVMPHDPAATGERIPSGLPILLRTYFAQQWFNLSDSAAEEALYESPVLRRFTGIDLNVAAAPDETAIRDFRQLLEENNLDREMLARVNRHLKAQGIQVSTTPRTDAKIVDASSSIGNAEGERNFQNQRAQEGAQPYAAADAYQPSELPRGDKGQVKSQELDGRRTQIKGEESPAHLLLSSGTLSVAIISPDSRRRNAATDALIQCQSGPIREFTSYPPNPNDVPQMLTRDFDVVLVDLDSDPEYALNLVKNICINGQATVIVYSEQTGQDLLLRSMRAGAREFLTLPFGQGAMAEALGRASALRSAVRHAPRTDGKLLVFLSAKGGSGVTTLACNSAVSLAQDSGRRTLLIDLNLPLGDAAINLGIRADHSVVAALENFKRLDSSFLFSLLEKHGSGLFVLAAPSELAPTHVSDEAIDKLLEVARQDFDYVVVDAGSKLDLQSTRVFDKSANIYLVAQIGIAELRNSNRLIARLSLAGGPKLEVILNRYDPRSLEIAEEQITKALTRPPDWKIPNNYAAVRRMQNTAVSLMRDDSEISRAIREMTRSISGQSSTTRKKKGFGFFR